MLLAAMVTAVLTITLFSSGTGGPEQHWVVRCPGAKLCARLEAGGRALFRPTPPDMACTLIYGGPEVALVRGRLNDRSVWARFTRRDGCAIARWNRVAFLLRK
jgi:hypothetical protein